MKLTPEEAERLTAEVQRDAAELWKKLLRLYEGSAHEVLGYQSWGAYFKARFGQSRAHGYRLLEAARVHQAVSLHVETRGMTEAQARVLCRYTRSEPDEFLFAVAEQVKAEGGWSAVSVRRIAEIRLEVAGFAATGPEDEPLWLDYRLNNVARAIREELRVLKAKRGEIADIANHVSPPKALRILRQLDEWRGELEELREFVAARAAGTHKSEVREQGVQLDPVTAGQDSGVDRDLAVRRDQATIGRAHPSQGR